MELVAMHHSQQNPVFSSICRSLVMFTRSWVMGSGLPGPFQNLGDDALWYSCDGSNLQSGAPLTGHPDYHLQYCRCNIMRHVLVLCSLNRNLFNVAVFFKILPEIKPSSFEDHIDKHPHNIDWMRKRFHKAYLWRNGVTFLWKEERKVL